MNTVSFQIERIVYILIKNNVKYYFVENYEIIYKGWTILLDKIILFDNIIYIDNCIVDAIRTLDDFIKCLASNIDLKIVYI